jgi:hypothetical protein
MSDGFDVYQKIHNFTLGGNGAVNPWYHAPTVNSKAEARALLATNTSAVAGVSFNAYSYGVPNPGITNYIFFSENIRIGLTTGTQQWTNYSRPTQSAQIYSTIKMPDGSTNGVISRVSKAATSANNGIYQPFPDTFPQVVKGKMYTLSVWAALDSVDGYPTTGGIRFSYYNGSESTFSADYELTTTPQRFSWTFIANTAGAATNSENIAIANASNSLQDVQQVLWGAQMIEGNVAGPYLPTSTNYNGLAAANSTAYATGVGYGVSEIVSTPVYVPIQSTVLANVAAFTIATNNINGAAPPSTLSVYGLY